MRTTILQLACLLAGCDYYGTPDEKVRPVGEDPGCPVDATLVLTIESFPTSDPVAADIDVIGTLSGNSVDFVEEIRLGAVAHDEPSPVASKPIVVTPASVWTTSVPLEVLLGANDAPGLVMLEATTVDGCNVAATTRSSPFAVDYPPPPVDAPPTTP